MLRLNSFFRSAGEPILIQTLPNQNPIKALSYLTNYHNHQKPCVATHLLDTSDTLGINKDSIF